jgi:hypothetical protein
VKRSYQTGPSLFPPVGPGPRVRFLRVRPSGGVTARRREVELSVERPLEPDRPAAGTVRLSARFETGEDGKRPSPSELTQELDALKSDLEALVGLPIAAVPTARPDRELTELIETYRPRQRELVDLLRDEGGLTASEHARLVEYLSLRQAEPKPRTAPPTSESERLIATVPIDRELAPAPRREGAETPPLRANLAPSSRPVPELLRTYQISTLRQAGAVRARRQISFAEYMALKRHFEEETAGRGKSPE